MSTTIHSEAGQFAKRLQSPQTPSSAQVAIGVPAAGQCLKAAQWQAFWTVAVGLMTEYHEALWLRTAAVHAKWAFMDARDGNYAEAKRSHEISEACKERAQLVRDYPDDFTDTAAVLADIFAEEVEPHGVRAA